MTKAAFIVVEMVLWLISNSASKMVMCGIWKVFNREDKQEIRQNNAVRIRD